MGKKTMAATSSRNQVQNKAIDRISKLSSTEIGHILSRLPTKDDVRTSVLSQAWEYKWTSIYDIVIDDKVHQSLTRDAWGSGYDSDFSYHHRRAKHMDDIHWRFVEFVIRVLLRTSKSRLRTFSLYCDVVYSNNRYLETFISEVLRRNIQNLTLVTSENCKIRSTRCFSGWTSLVECNLALTCTLSVPVNSCFPNLKKLRLAGAYYGALRIVNKGIDNTRQMLLNFSVLEALEIKYCEWLDVDSVEIQAPELTEFKIYCLPELKSCEIKVLGPKLAKFESADGTIHNFVVSCPTVTYAVLDHYVYDHHFESLDHLGLASDALIKGLPNVECLKLSSSVVHALVEPSLELVLPTFDQLKELELLCGGHIIDIMLLLRALPPLESLTLQLSSLDKNEPYWEDLARKINLSRLKEVTFIRFIGTESQYDFAKFILKKAMKLERMHLPVRSEWVMTKIKSRLSGMKPKDSSCVLDVVVKEQV